MANNYKAGGSGAGDWFLSFNIEEASIMSENNILVPPGWKLSHGWRISAGGMVVPPIPLKWPTMNAYIERQRRALSPEQRNSPNRSSNSELWRPLFQKEWRNTVAKFDIGAPTHTRYNIADRRAW
jgi:hypothetical protein